MKFLSGSGLFRALDGLLVWLATQYVSSVRMDGITLKETKDGTESSKGSVRTASDSQTGVSKLYTDLGHMNTDGSVTQKAINEGLDEKADKNGDPSEDFFAKILTAEQKIVINNENARHSVDIVPQVSVGVMQTLTLPQMSGTLALTSDIPKRFNIKLEVKGYDRRTQTNNTRINIIKTIIENYSSELTGSEYKMFLLRWRKKGWKAATLAPSGSRNVIRTAGKDCWSITSNKQEWWDGDYAFDALPCLGVRLTTSGIARFVNTHMTTQKIGCAIYRNTGEGHYGWLRVSNIAFVKLTARQDYSYCFCLKEDR